MKRVLLALVLCVMVGCRAQSRGDYQPQSGDVIFQSFPHSPLTDTIESVSLSPFSHCGLVIKRGSKVVVCEAIGPVQDTPLDAWIKRGRNQAFAVYRLNDSYAAKIEGFVQAAETFRGRPYDIHYAFDDERIYCSELVFKAFKKSVGEDLGLVKRLGDLNWRPNEAFIRKIENGGLPLEREMITPQDLSEAKQLHQVYKNGF